MRIATRLLVCFVLVAGWLACDKPTPVAPAESSLTITANPTRIAVNGTATITVLARKSDGRAVNPGTEINFSTDLGTIDPVALTDDRGIAEATLTGDGRIGMATVAVNSGAAMSEEIMVQIGALASSITLSANKSEVNKDLPSGGERIKLTAEVFDDLANPISGVSVIFEADTGTFEEGGSVETNSKGRARNVLVVTEVRNVTDGVFEITVRTAGDDGAEVSDTVEIGVSGFAFDITLTTDPTSIPFVGGTIRLSALVRDDFGEAAVGESVNFITEAGSLSSGGALLQTDANGQVFDTLTVTQADLAALPATAISFNVSAEVAGSGGELVSSGDVPIRIQPEPPIAGFETTIVDRNVTFRNTSTGGGTLRYQWDFGDGSTSNEVSPSHLYDADGTFFVTLIATNDGGESSITKTVTVMETPGDNPALNVSIAFQSEIDQNSNMIRDEGDDLNFEIIATNAGDVNLTNVTVVSSLPVVVTPPTSALSCVPTSGSNTLQPGETIVCSQTHRITGAEEALGQVVNTATADNAVATAVSAAVTVSVP